MILEHLTMCGFRGVRDKLELSLPDGFMVVSGSNGSGKSTLCDAIEYALTGRFRESQHKEKGESIADYTWWRGNGDIREHVVSLVLRRPDNTKVVVTRTPSGLTLQGTDDIADALCHKATAPADAVARLCRTSIIRDEEITALSVDLAETDRYEFVRLALGMSDFGELEKTAKDVQAILASHFHAVQANYTTIRDRVSETTARLSSARSEAAGSEDVDAASRSIRDICNVSESVSTRQLLELATRAIADRRVLLDNMLRLVEQLQSLEQRQMQVQSDAYRHRLEELVAETAGLRGDLSSKEAGLRSVEQRISELSDREPRLAALARLHQSGEQLGLDDDQRCPLCGSPVSGTDFAEHLRAMKDIIRAASEATLQSSDLRAQLVTERDVLRHKLTPLEQQLIEGQGAKAKVESEYEELVTRAMSLGIREPHSVNVVALLQQIETLRTGGVVLERSVAILEASRAVERVSRLEGELGTARTNAESLQRAMESVNKAVERLRDAGSNIRRIRGEVVDESLAELSPLMAELFLRLRPHVDWQELVYRLRGDVRRFLSFEVGDGLNPTFVLSSGQRRAAGIAFLLAVYLARPWCQLQTLVLDDPVQHVDDFRALNLTEVLAAIRRSGKQIICTTEDDALAELMCRRLRSSQGSEGRFVRMAYDSAKGIHVAATHTVPPLANGVLVSA
jgi:DNA repair exonuclease SbcCD ATPase subunit